MTQGRSRFFTAVEVPMSESIQWADQPMWDEGIPRYPIVRVRSSKPIGGVFANQAVIGVHLHWMEGRSVPCIGLPVCAGCKALRSTRWAGYQLAEASNGLVFVVELTEGAFYHLRSQVPDVKSLRGIKFQLHREKPHFKKSRILCPISSTGRNEVKVDETDIRPLLCCIWGVSRVNMIHRLMEWEGGAS